jgi:hypothetical protein
MESSAAASRRWTGSSPAARTPPELEARGDNKQAAHYYRKALEFIRQRPDQYDDGKFEAVFQRLIAKLDPPAP